MLKNPKAQMALVLSIGLLAGYAAASGKLNPFRQANAHVSQQAWAFRGPVGEPGRGHRSTDVRTADVLVAARNSAVQEKAAESGKKPNILNAPLLSAAGLARG